VGNAQKFGSEAGRTSPTANDVSVSQTVQGPAGTYCTFIWPAQSKIKRNPRS